LYSSPNIFPLIKSRTRWTEHTVRREDRRGAYRVLMERPEENGPLGRP